MMEGAERLCDRVAIIDGGRVIDVDTPDALVAKHCPTRTVIVTTTDPSEEGLFRALPCVEEVTARDGAFTVRGRGGELVTGVIQCVSVNRIHVTGFRADVPTLEDVFLTLTGHSIRS